MDTVSSGGADTRAGPEWVLGRILDGTGRVPGRILDRYRAGTGAGNERGSVSHEQASSRGYFDGGERAAEAWSAA